MQFGYYIVFVGIFITLLVPVLVWVKDRWSGFSITVKYDRVPYMIRGRTLDALALDLQRSAYCSRDQAVIAIRRYGTEQLERDEAWPVLADLSGMPIEAYFLYAVKERIIDDISRVPARYRASEIRDILEARGAGLDIGTEADGAVSGRREAD